MPDIKTTTRALRHTIKMFETHSMINVSCNDYFTDMLKNTLDIIEEQSKTIGEQDEILSNLLQQFQEIKMIYGMDVKTVEKVVRCRDCIWYHEGKNGKSNKCNYHGGVTEENRYCWWGETDA